MSSIVQPTRVLLDPLDATGAAIEARRWFWPLLILALCVSASGTAFSLRWDAGPAVVQELQMTGKLDRMTESEISEEIQTASRKALVAGIAKGVFVMPMMTLVLAAALWVFAWLFDKSAPFGRLMSAAALAMLPIALYHLVFAICALAQYSLTEARVQDLVPSSLAALGGLSPKMKQVLKGVDFFNLWSVGLLGLGFSAATGMRKERAVLLCLVLYVLYIGVFSIGVPAMMAGGPGGGPRGPGGGR
ncbi:YIP1 family protein [Vitiosangium sp. GDMCC 1.1324]|uniref:YIP1 family protein n=1 Tax=Vitiosangium sp. (strain GDMCC 1.1324) TaxID=2138576 RepID=UPI000D3C8606|nr:YIP1 family protein [Vitiosangium sp. GDMCC 1.1324]PTL85313.1 YIP1 family protein [Vitiosangium sp. GDMCC 1.1324]